MNIISPITSASRPGFRGGLSAALIIVFLLINLAAVSSQSMIGESMIGMEKEELVELVRKNHREFRKDQSVVRQQFNYLKYVNGLRTFTWILYFTEEDICKTSKLVSDYSEFDDVVEKLTDSYRKVGDSRWEYTLDSDTVHVTLTRQEWYFTVRESKEP